MCNPSEQLLEILSYQLLDMLSHTTLLRQYTHWLLPWLCWITFVFNTLWCTLSTLIKLWFCIIWSTASSLTASDSTLSPIDCVWLICGSTKITVDLIGCNNGNAFDGLPRNIPPQELELGPLLMYNASNDAVMLLFIQLCSPWISCRTCRPIHSCYNNALVSLVSIYRLCYMESLSTSNCEFGIKLVSFYDLLDGILVVQFDVTV